MNILAIESASTVCGTALFLEDKMVDMELYGRAGIAINNHLLDVLVWTLPAFNK